MLHYQVVRTSPGGATLSNKLNNTMHYRHVRHTLALMCAKNHLLIFSSFLDIWENVEWPRFFRPPCRSNQPFSHSTSSRQTDRLTDWIDDKSVPTPAYALLIV